MDLQKSPIALTGAFELKVTGRQPTQFGEAVTPIADVYDQYLATSELDLSIDTTAPGLAASVLRSFTVPTGKAWRVLGAGNALVLNAADLALTETTLIGVQSPNSGNNSVVLAAQQQSNTGTIRAFGTKFERPLFLPSGWKIVVQVFLSAAITIAGTNTASVLRQEISL